MPLIGTLEGFDPLLGFILSTLQVLIVCFSSSDDCYCLVCYCLSFVVIVYKFRHNLGLKKLQPLFNIALISGVLFFGVCPTLLHAFCVLNILKPISL